MGANISCMNKYSTRALETEMFQGTNLIDLLEKNMVLSELSFALNNQYTGITIMKIFCWQFNKVEKCYKWKK